MTKLTGEFTVTSWDEEDSRAGGRRRDARGRDPGSCGRRDRQGPGRVADELRRGRNGAFRRTAGVRRRHRRTREESSPRDDRRLRRQGGCVGEQVVEGSGTGAWTGLSGEEHSARRTATRRPSPLTAASTEAGWTAEARERQASNLLGALCPRALRPARAGGDRGGWAIGERRRRTLGAAPVPRLAESRSPRAGARPLLVGDSAAGRSARGRWPRPPRRRRRRPRDLGRADAVGPPAAPRRSRAPGSSCSTRRWER